LQATGWFRPAISSGNYWLEMRHAQVACMADYGIINALALETYPHDDNRMRFYFECLQFDEPWFTQGHFVCDNHQMGPVINVPNNHLATMKDLGWDCGDQKFLAHLQLVAAYGQGMTDSLSQAYLGAGQAGFRFRCCYPQ
jgi:hypothetical protein